MKVRAKDIGQTYSGYYNYVRRRPGDVFELIDEKDFSESWMERVPDDTPVTRAPGEPSPAEIAAERMALSQAAKAKRPKSATERLVEERAPKPSDAEVI